MNSTEATLIGAATDFSAGDYYSINVLYCPATAMPSPMTLSETTHIYAFSSNVVFQFSSTKFGIRYKTSSANDDFSSAYLWFQAPWDEDIVDIIPSKSNNAKVLV